MWISIVRISLQKAISMLILVCCACSGSNEAVSDTRFWKYSDGFTIGDMLDFRQSRTRLRRDTIFLADSAVARVLKIENRWLTADRVLYIESLRHNTIGRYVAK